MYAPAPYPAAAPSRHTGVPARLQPMHAHHHSFGGVQPVPDFTPRQHHAADSDNRSYQSFGSASSPGRVRVQFFAVQQPDMHEHVSTQQ